MELVVRRTLDLIIKVKENIFHIREMVVLSVTLLKGVLSFLNVCDVSVVDVLCFHMTKK